MNSLLKRVRQLDDEELQLVSEAIDIEMSRRLQRDDPIPESARRRAIERQQSYSRHTGAAAPPIRAVGLRPHSKRRLAA